MDAAATRGIDRSVTGLREMPVEKKALIAKTILAVAVLGGVGLLIVGSLKWTAAENMVQLEKAKVMAGFGMALLKASALGVCMYCCWLRYSAAGQQLSGKAGLSRDSSASAI